MDPRHYGSVASRLLIALTSEADPDLTMARACRLACETLGALESDLADGSLRRDVEHLNALANATWKDVERALQGPVDLFEVFLLAETRALREAGIPQNVVDALRLRARQVRESIDPKHINLDELRNRVDRLRREVCEFATQAEEIQTIRERVKASAYVLAGASVIGIDASVDAVTTLGLAPWMTVVSGAVGGALITKVFGA